MWEIILCDENNYIDLEIPDRKSYANFKTPEFTI